MSTIPGLLVALVAASAPQPRGEVIDFSAKWCGPCQSIAPTVARLERDGLPIRTVDVDQQRDLAQRYGVTAMPTFVLIVDGQEVDRHEGILNETQLRAWLNRIPQGSPAADLSCLEVAQSQSQSFVADPSVRLGSPQSLSQPREQSESLPSTPRNSQPAAFPVTSAPLADARSVSNSEGSEIRASNSALGSSPASPPAADTPLSASARLRVTIDGRINLGSGTVIFSDGRQALIVTCGHIFRGFTTGSQIEVNLFDGGDVQSVAGRLVKFDEQSDVGLVLIDTDRELPTVAVARDAQRPREQEPVVSIGCSGGQLPTVEELVVTAVNPYIGPDNLECNGVPVQGRSGGGLFRTTGELVAVCIAADPARKRGVYAGLLAVHDLLTEAGYASLFQPPQTAVAAVSGGPFDELLRGNAAAESDAAAGDGALLDALTPANQFPGRPASNGAEDSAFAFNSPADRSVAIPNGVPVELAAGASDAEIVCIIRSRDPAQPDSQVVIIHQASPKLLSYLRGEMATEVQAGDPASLLSREQPRRPRSNSVPTAEVTRQPSTGSELFPGSLTSVSHRPTLQPTSMTTPVQPRRYVRSR